MNFEVVNKALQVGDIRIVGVSASSVVLVGDTEVIALSSMFDSPPEAVTVAPLVPLPPPQALNAGEQS